MHIIYLGQNINDATRAQQVMTVVLKKPPNQSRLIIKPVKEGGCGWHTYNKIVKKSCGMLTSFNSYHS